MSLEPWTDFANKDSEPPPLPVIDKLCTDIITVMDGHPIPYAMSSLFSVLGMSVYSLIHQQPNLYESFFEDMENVFKLTMQSVIDRLNNEKENKEII